MNKCLSLTTKKIVSLLNVKYAYWKGYRPEPAQCGGGGGSVVIDINLTLGGILHCWVLPKCSRVTTEKDISQAAVSISCNSSLICILFFNPQQSPFKFKHSNLTDLQDYKDLQNSVGGPALLSHLVTTVSASYAGRIELHDDWSKQALCFLLYSLIPRRHTILKLNKAVCRWILTHCEVGKRNKFIYLSHRKATYVFFLQDWVWCY